ncbi:MAG: DsbE family thiol:disulfide interchange protein [Chromatiales bacterium]
MLRYALPLTAFVLLIALLVVGLRRDPRLVPSPFIDNPAPGFDLPQLRDPAKRITTDDLKGTATLVNVWASWCVACRDEHPLLLDLARTSELRIIGLNYKDERKQALAWLRRLGDPYEKIAYDGDGRAAIEWGVYGVPESFLVDAGGVIRLKHVGPLTPEVVASELLPRLRETGPRSANGAQ